MKYIIHEEQVKAVELPGRSLRWLVTPEMNLSEHFSMNTVAIKPGDTVKPAHAHPKTEEVIYVAGGKGKAYIDGKVYELNEGTTVIFKPGMVHMLTNDGDQVMKVVCFFTPPATLADYTFYEEIEFPFTENLKEI
jgi:quercetin dioxygenase-like cupin family protein